MNNPLLVGIDVHRKTNVYAVMNQQGQELCPRFRLANNRPGTQQSIAHLVELLQASDADGLRVAVEATGWYWFHLFETLTQDAALAAWPVELYAFNPRLTAHYKQIFNDLDKTDQVDAFVIADRLRHGRQLPVPFRHDEQYLPLRLLTRYRYHVVHNLAREKAYCLAILYLKASEYTHPDKQPFSDVFGVTSRSVLQEFASLEEVAAMPVADLAEWLDVHGKRRFADPLVNARNLQQVARDSYPLSPALQAPLNLLLGFSFQQITQLEGLLKRLDTAIAAALQACPNTLTSIPGIGPVFAAGLVAEIGDLARFAYDQAKVAKFAGFQWRQTQSADFQADETHLTRTGNPYLRYYFCEAANAVCMHDADYHAFFQKKYREVRTHQHLRALVLTARKLVRLVVCLLTTHQTYQPRRPASAP